MFCGPDTVVKDLSNLPFTVSLYKLPTALSQDRETIGSWKNLAYIISSKTAGKIKQRHSRAQKKVRTAEQMMSSCFREHRLSNDSNDGVLKWER